MNCLKPGGVYHFFVCCQGFAPGFAPELVIVSSSGV
jgi:hypothetical protein